ncbi:MAG: NAD(P)-dependent oxidoreductase [Acidobacteriota bacterium]
MRIGFIGLGIMGRPMAENLVKAGYFVAAYNRTAEKAEAFVAAVGADRAAVASTPAEAAAGADVVITIVRDTDAVRSVLLGAGGVAEGARPGLIVVDMSTIAPRAEQEMASELAKRDVTLLDAPVSGGDVGARAGTLAIMVGGERSAYEEVLPVLQAMGKKITYCGGVGAGQLTKLCNQILVAVTLLGVSEALNFARRSGLDPALVIEATREGAAGSWQLANLGPRIVSGDFAPGFMVDLMQKDLRLVLEAGDDSRSVLPATALVHQLFHAAQRRGWGREGTQVLARVLALLNAAE